MDYVWAIHPDPEIAWIPARFIEDRGKALVYETEKGERFEVPAKEGRAFSAAAPSSLTMECSNLVALEEFTEGAIIHQLRKRYQKDEIYTWIGTILVSMNPFKRLPIYTNNILHSYLNHADLSSADPHCYAIAARAYQGLMLDHEPQAFIISGESGAGKTEATKLILQYLSEAAGSPDGVEQQILQTNPLLESFGNSKTLRNNNSSRFGKWMEIRFSKAGKISGARIVNYLLEKSRVVFQAEQERNYHIFYQLCVGNQILDEDLRSLLCLEGAEHFTYLNQSGCMKVDGIDDFQEFQDTHNSLLKLGFSPEEMSGIYRIVAGILHLGNLTFRGDSGDGSSISSRDELETAGLVLGIPEQALEKALTTRSVKFGADWTDIKLRPDDASGARHSIAKALFTKLFDWIVKRVNQRLSISKDKDTIGVLDIFGFEVFQTNSFEQFCINFANEKLQQHFTHHIFKMEQDEYASEGISVDRVDFVDNEAAILLIEGRPGIIASVDEEVRVPKGTDSSLIEKMHQTFFRDKSTKSTQYGLIKTNPDIFVIEHYAGGVEYTITGFLEKNKDTLHDSLAAAVHASEVSLISSLLEQDASSDPSPGTKRGMKKTKGKLTLGTQFKSQLDKLMVNLNSAEPHYVRCIKPNLEKLPDKFTSRLALNQMNYSGLFEAIRIRAMGYAYRKTYTQFWNSYCVCLAPADRSAVAGDRRKGCAKIVEVLGDQLNTEDLQLGKTKIFYRASQLSILEKARVRAITANVLYLQSRVRGFLARKYYARLQRVAGMVRLALDTQDWNDVMRAQQAVEEKGVELFIARGLTALVEFLKAQKLVVELLVAGTAEKNMDKLMAATAKAVKLEMRTKSRSQQALGALQAAEDMIAHLEQVQRVKQAIGAAIAALDCAALEKAVEQAKSCGLDADLVSKAEKELSELKRQDKIVSALKKTLGLTGKLDVGRLEESLQATDSLDLDTKREQLIQQGCDILLEHYRQEFTRLSRKKQQRDQVKEMLNALKNSFVWNDCGALVEEILGWLKTTSKSEEDEDVLGALPVASERVRVVKNVGDDEKGMLSKLDSVDFEEIPHSSPRTTKSKVRETSKIGWCTLSAEEEAMLLKKLRKGLQELDRSKLSKLVALARESGMKDCAELAQAREICYVMSEQQFLDLRLVQALELGDPVLLKSLLSEASRLQLYSENVLAARHLLSAKLEETRVKMGKEGRFRDYAGDYQQFRDLHPLAQYSMMKDAEDFGKKGLFVNKAVSDGMLKYSDQPLPRCLLRHPLERFESRAVQKEIKDELLRVFVDILCWMKVKYHQYPSSLATTLISSALRQPLLQDEIYAQLIKQTTQNPVLSSVVLAFKLLYLCLTAFRPSPEMEECLKTHLASLGSPLVSKFTAFDVAEELASRCFEVLLNPSLVVGRAPTEQEAKAMYNLASERLEVRLDFDPDQGKNDRVPDYSLEEGVGTTKRKKKKNRSTENITILRVPNIPKVLAHLLPYREHDSVFYVEDLVAEVSQQRRLPFIGSLYLKNTPPESSLPQDSILPDDTELGALLSEISKHGYEKKVEWRLCVGDQAVASGSGSGLSRLQEQLQEMVEKSQAAAALETDALPPPPPPPELFDVITDAIEPPPEPILYDSDGMEIPPPPLEDLEADMELTDDLMTFFQNVPAPPPVDQLLRPRSAHSTVTRKRKTTTKQVVKKAELSAEEKARIDEVRKTRFEERKKREEQLEANRNKAKALLERAAEMKAKASARSSVVSSAGATEEEESKERGRPKFQPMGGKQFQFKSTGNLNKRTDENSGISQVRKISFQALKSPSSRNVSASSRSETVNVVQEVKEEEEIKEEQVSEKKASVVSVDVEVRTSTASSTKTIGTSKERGSEFQLDLETIPARSRADANTPTPLNGPSRANSEEELG